jgi:hypothetical protein
MLPSAKPLSRPYVSPGTLFARDVSDVDDHHVAVTRRPSGSSSALAGSDQLYEWNLARLLFNIESLITQDAGPVTL